LALETQKATEVKMPDALNVLLYGDVGTGKTTFATTFPKPLLFFDFDLRSQNYAGMDGVEFIEYREEDETKPKAYSKFRRDLRELQRENRFSTIVLDSTTAMFDVVAADVTGGVGKSDNKANEGLTQPQWGKIQNRFGEIFTMLRSFGCHVIVTSHERVVKDEVDGSTKILTMNCGRSFPQKAPGYFDEVWRTFVKVGRDGPQYMLQTAVSRKYFARTSFNKRDEKGNLIEPVLDDEEPQDFDHIWSKIEEARDG